MMYNEFLELSGKSESYISYKEYTEEIEPIYMACDLPTKEDFIKAFNETFERIVYPIVENTISNFSTEEKLAYLYSFRREEMDESVRMFDRKARQIAYDYMKLYLMVDLEEWYDVLIIPYLQAVKKYFSYPDLRKYKFEKICFRTLDSARKNHWIKAERRKCYPSGKYFYYPTQTTTEDEALALGMLKVAVESLTDTQREILLSLVNGSRSSDVIEKLGISSATYCRQVRTIKQIIRGEENDV